MKFFAVAKSEICYAYCGMTEEGIRSISLTAFTPVGMTEEGVRSVRLRRNLSRYDRRMSYRASETSRVYPDEILHTRAWARTIDIYEIILSKMHVGEMGAFYLKK